MRKLILTIAAAAALLAGSLTNRADALTIGNPAGLRAAIDATTTTEQVAIRCTHRWYGHWHRYARCFHYYPRYSLYYGPRVYFGPRFAFRHHRRHWW